MAKKNGSNSIKGSKYGDHLYGQTTSEYIDGRAGDDVIHGNGGDDRIDGGAGNDTIYGGGGDDVIDGGSGNDRIYGNGGNDALDGGSGDDEIFGGWGADSIQGGSGNDTIHGNGGADTIDGGSGDDTIHGGWADDVIEGGSGDDLILGNGGHDILSGGSGNDQIEGGWGNDEIDGGAGNDTIVGNGGHDVLAGGEGDDTIAGGWGNDEIDGGAGDDTIRGNGGHDVMSGGDGDDDIQGDWGNDQIDGGAGNDVIRAEGGNDTVYGGAGSDNIQGGGGDDILIGDALDIAPGSGAGSGGGASSGSGSGYGGGSGSGSGHGSGHGGGSGSGSGHGSGHGGGSGSGSGHGSGYGGGSGSGHGSGSGKGHGSGSGSGHGSGYGGGSGSGHGSGSGKGYGSGSGSSGWHGGSGSASGSHSGSASTAPVSFDDYLDGGAGNDILLGQWGDDTLLGGSGNDILDGGAGTDVIDAGTGNDIGIFVGGENGGGVDSYDGNKGTDTLVVSLTAAQFADTDIQGELVALQAFIAANANPNTNGGPSLTLTHLGLEVQDWEDLVVLVDGQPVEVDPDNPVDANADSANASESAAVTIDVLANDSAPDGVASVTILSQPAGGTVTVNPDKSVTFDPAGDFEGLAEGETVSVTFTYKLQDADGDHDTAAVTVTICGTNDAPAVQDVAIGAAEDGPTVSGAFDGSDVDSDDDASSLTYAITGGPSEGSIVNNGDGTFTFDPGSDFQDLNTGETRIVTVDYTATDSHGAVSNTGTITITVTGQTDLEPLFTVNPDSVDFDTVEAGGYIAGTQYDALDSDDTVWMASDAGEAAVAGFDPSETFNAGDGDDTVYGRDLDDRIEGDAGDDALYGGGADDTLGGGAGNDTIFGDAQSAGGTAETRLATGDAAAWTGAGVTLSALNQDGSEGAVNYTGDGVGVIGGAVGPQEGEINHAPDDTSEALVASFCDPVSEATVTVSRFYPGEVGGEWGQWSAYDALGNLVGTGTFGPDIVTTDGHIGSFTISGIGAFTDIHFTALAYGDGTPGSSSDSSDYYVQSVEYTTVGSATDAGDDYIKGGAGDDVIYGQGGNDTLHGDDPDAVVPAQTFTATGNAAAWAAAGVSLSALDFDGTPGSVTYQGNGVGVSGGSPVGGQINHDSDGTSETLVADFGGPVSEATVTVSNLYASENGGEVGRWQAFDGEGTLVGEGTFGPEVITSGGHVGSFTISGIGEFTEIRFTATEYGNGTAPGASDSSDYYVRSITYTTAEPVEGGNDYIEGGAGDDVIRGQGGDDTLYGDDPDACGVTTEVREIAADCGVYDVTGASEITFTLDYLSSLAGYDNAIGYYLADAGGNPMGGAVVFADIKSAGAGVGDAVTITLDGSDLSGAVSLGFFLIPNGDNLNAGLADGDAVTFSGSGGSWDVLKGGSPLSGQGADVLFSNPALNPAGYDHEGDTATQGNMNWEDLVYGGDKDFDDGNFDVAVQGTWLHSGDDDLDGGAGNDYLDGNEGADIVYGNDGDDIGAFVVGQVGGLDVYDGGTGTDTLRVYVTAAQYADSDIHADLQALKAFIQANSDPLTDGGADATFVHLDLNVEDWEALEIYVDGELVSDDNDADAVDDAADAGEDGPAVVIDVLANDDVPDGVDSVTIVTGPSEGTAIVNPDNTITYDPTGGFEGLAEGETTTVTFTYEVTDSDGDTDTATVTVTVTGTNDAPVVQNVATTAVEDGPAVTGSFDGNDADSDDDGTSLTYTITGTPSEGSVTNNNDGTFAFDPGPDFQDLAPGETRDVTFTYEATDSHGAVSNTGTVTVTVTGTNDAPVVQNVASAAVEDGPAVTGSFDGDDADSDDDGTSLTYAITGTPSEGSVTNNNDGTFAFDPGPDFQDLAPGETRDVTFTYEATDSHGAVSNTGTVTVTVTGTNDAPVVQNVASAASEDGPAVIDAFDGDDIDSDDDGTTLTYTVTGAPAAGIVVNNGDGTFSFDPNGEFESLAAGETADVTFTYEATDSHGAVSNTGTVTVTVTGTNDAPEITFTAGNDAGAVEEDGTLTATGSLVGADADGGATLAWSVVGGGMGSYGGLAVDANGEWTYTLDNGSASVQALAEGETVTDVFTVEVTDEHGASDTQTVTITITGDNDAPVIAGGGDDAGAVTEDGTLVATGDFDATDIDNGATQSWVVAGGGAGAYGALAVDANGGWSYTLDNGSASVQALGAGETVTDTFTVEVTDEHGASDTQTVTITVTGTNDAPEITFSAGNDAGAVEEDGTLTATGGLSATDVDSSATLAWSVVGGGAGSYGGLSVDTNGGWTYTLDNGSAPVQGLAEGETVTDVFTVEVEDQFGGTDTQTVTITITGDNDAPVITSGGDTTGSVEEDTTLTAAGDFDATDVDNGAVLSWSVVGSGAGAYGALAVDANGSWIYTLDNGSAAVQSLGLGDSVTDTFTVEVTDEHGASDTQTVTITVTGTNDGPSIGVADTAGGVTELTDADAGENLDDLTDSGSIAFADADLGDGHTVSVVPTGSGYLGTFAAMIADAATGDGSGSVDWTFTVNDGLLESLNEGEQIVQSYDVTVDDGNGGTATETVTITITGTNDVPVVQNVASAAAEDGPAVTGSFDGDDADSDDDGTSLTYTITGTPSEGSVVNNNDGTFAFDPGPDFQDLAPGETRDVTFTYEATDSHGAVSNTGTVTVTVTGTNDAPVVQNVASAAAEDGPAVTGSFDGDDADSDDDGTSLTYTITGTPSEGSVVNNNDGTFAFDPGPDFQDLAPGETRDVTFTYEATDSHGAVSNTGTVTVTVTGTNDAPVVQNVASAAAEDGPAVTGSFDGDDADSDDDGTSLTYTITGTPSEGSVVNNNDGTFAFDPGPDFQDLAPGETRDVTFTYEATDSHGAVSNTGTVTVTVTGTNDAPVVQNVASAAAEDGPAVTGSFDGDDADSDDDGTSLTYTITGTPSEGSVVNNNDGTFAFDPGPDFQDLAPGETRDVTFTYEATDSHGAVSNTGTVTVTVTGTNDAPVVQNVASAASEDGPAVIDAFDGDDIDSDDDGTTLTYTVTGAPAAGIVVNNGDGTFSFDPNGEFESLAAGETADVTFTYEATDSHGAVSNTGTVTVTITGENDAPDALDDLFSVTEDVMLTGNVLADNGNGADSDVDNGATLAVIAATITTAEGGTVSLLSDGSFTYTPAEHFSGTDSFTYTVEDEHGASDTATATISVIPDADVPDLVVVDPAIGQTGQPIPLSITVDFPDQDGSEIHTITICDMPAGATLNNGTQNTDGSWTLTPGDLAGLTITMGFSGPAFDADFNLSDLLAANGGDGSQGFVVKGIGSLDPDQAASLSTTDAVGYDVSNAGDINGDGIDDFMVSGILGDANGTNSGEVYVVYGSTAGFPAELELYDLLAANGGDGSVGFVINGIQADDRIGTAIRAAGDVNGDGIDDLLIGGFRADANGIENVGQAYVVYGNAAGFGAEFELSSLDGTNGIIVNGAPFSAGTANDATGDSLSGGYDLNGDGAADLIVGAWGNDAALGFNDNGATYVVFGGANLADLDDDDGSLDGRVNMTEVDGTKAFKIEGIDFGDRAGAKVSGIGDVNGDGIDDLLIGARLADANGSNSGEGYVVFGGMANFQALDAADGTSDGIIELANLTTSSGYTFRGVAAGDEAGRAISDAGDVNGDGISDILIGAYLNDAQGGSSGAAYVVYGGAGGLAALDAADGTVDGSIGLDELLGANGGDGSLGFATEAEAAGDRLGRDVRAVGDVNGDGIDDLIVGAPFADANGKLNAGGAYVIFGSAGGFDAEVSLADIRSGDGTKGFALDGIDAGDLAGWSVSGAGDVDGDGIDDIVIGAYAADPNGITSGEAYVVFGRQGISSGDFTITVKANATEQGNGDGETVTDTITIDLNEAPSVEDDSFAIDENAPNGTYVGTAVGTDPDVWDTISYAITGGSGVGVFTIDANTGDITVIDSGALDYETTSVFTLTVEVTDSFGETDSAVITIDLNDVIENLPPDIADDATSVDENAANGTFVVNVPVSDPDAGDTHTYTAVGGTGFGIFAIDDNGDVTVIDGSALDFEGGTTSYTLEVEVEDAGGLTDTATITIGVGDVNEAPDIDDDSTMVDENSANGTFVLNVPVTDPDTGDTHTYTATGGTGFGIFDIDGNGDVTVIDGSQLDFETTSSYTLEVEVEDAGGLTDTATITIDLNDVNEAPVVEDMAEAAVEDGPAVTALFDGDDVDADDDQSTLTYAITSAPSEGSVVNNNDGTFAFDPGPDFQDLAEGETRDVTFTYEATDSHGAVSNTGTVTVTVTGTNDAPEITFTAGNDAGAVEEDGTLTATGSLVGADADSGATLVWSVVGGGTGSYGGLAVDANGEWTYTLDNGSAPVQALAAGETVTDTFTVEVTDEHGASDTQTVTVTVTGDNDAPVIAGGGDVAGAVVEDGTLVATGDFDASDIDNGAVLSWSVAGGGTGAYGALAVDGNGGWTYTLDNGLSAIQELAPGETVTDTFTVEVIDEHGAADTETVTITITGTNDAPVVENVTTTVGEDGPSVTGSFVGDDADSDDDGTTLSYAITTAPSGGSVINNNDGTFSFDPAGDFDSLADGESVDVTFTYEATDSHGAVSNTGTVTVTVTGTNDAPEISFVAGNDAGAVEEDTTLTATGSLVGTDADNDAVLTWDVQGGGTGSYGSLAVDGNGEWTYTLDNGSGPVQALAEGETVTDVFTVEVTDEHGASDTQTVTITITGDNDAPVITSGGDTAGSVQADDTLTATGDFDATDIDNGATQSWAVAGGGTGSYGGLSVDTNGSWTYTLDNGSPAVQSLAAGETLTDSFTVEVTDEHGAADTETVTITITGTNDAPVIGAGDTSGGVTELTDADAGENVDDLTDSGSIAFSDQNLSDSHTVSANPNGVGYLGTFAAVIADAATGDGSGSVDWTFTVNDGLLESLNEGEQIVQSYDVTVDDGNGGTATETVTITITGTNDVPVVQNVTAPGATEDGPAVTGSFDGDDADSDDDGTTLTYTVTGAPAAGIVVNNGDGTFSFDPNGEFESLAAGETTDVTFTYEATDSHGAVSNTGTVTVTVTGTNDAPEISFTAGNDAGAVEEDGTLVASGTLAGSDADNGATLSWSVLGGSTASVADYEFSMDSLHITKNGSPIYYIDEFDDGVPPPVGEMFGGVSQGSYFTVGTQQEADGKLTLHGVLANVQPSSFTPAELGFHSALLNSVTTGLGDPRGLKVDDDFAVEGVFDLVMPDEELESYGIRLTDNAGDDVLYLRVGFFGGSAKVELVSFNFVTDTATLIDSTALTPGAGDDQILLRLDHVASNPGVVTASFDFLDGGSATGTTTFASTGNVFGTDTVTATDDEVWTRAQIVSTGPTESASVLAGTYGTLALKQNGEWTYGLNNNSSAVQTLAEGETVTDDFTVEVTDEHGASDTQTITVTVTGENDAPVVIGGDVAGAVAEDGTLVATGDLDATDIDNGAILGWSVAGGGTGSYGALAVDGNGSWTYTLDNGSAAVQGLAVGETQDEVFTVVVTDEHGATDTETVTVTVAGANDAPEVENVALAATEDGPVVTDAFVGDDADSDDDGSTLTYAITSAPSEGSVVNNNDGTFSFDPGTDFQDLAGGETRDVTLTYEATDSHGAVSNTGTITVTVTGTNDAPVAAADAFAAIEDTLLAGNVLADNGSGADSDADATDTLSVLETVIATAQGGIVTMAPDGSFSYTPPPHFSGTDSFTYTLSDGTATDTAVATIEVEAVADQPVVVTQTASGPSGTPIALDIAAGFPDMDGSEAHTITVSGLPEGASLNQGTDQGGGVWTLTPAQLAGLAITAPTPGPIFGSSYDLNLLDASNGGDGSLGFIVNGTAGDASGFDVASAGDVNGDGYADLLISAILDDRNSVTNVGATYVVFGSAAGFGAELDVASMSTTQGYTFFGSLDNERAGETVRSAGDVNGDGYDDIFVGAPRADGVGPVTGRSYVVFGSAGNANFAALDALDGNSDGKVELSYLLDANGGDGSRGLVFHGAPASAPTSNEFSGYSIDGGYDFNGDGIEDLIIGSRGNDFDDGSTVKIDPGATYVVFGQTAGWTAEFTLSDINGPGSFTEGVAGTGDGTQGVLIRGINTGDQSGYQLSGVADMNGDGRDEVIIGARFADPHGIASAGQVYLVYGSNGMGAEFEASTLDGTNGYIFNGTALNERLGRAVGEAGDVNGDGFADMIFGSYNHNAGAGRSYVVFGGTANLAAMDLADSVADGTIELSEMLAANGGDGSTGFVLHGIDANDRAGWYVRGAGDINGDGFADVVVGAPNGSGGNGEAYVILGRDGGFAPEIDLADLMTGDGTDGFAITGRAGGDKLGWSVNAAGDVNGDGIDDLIIGAYGADPNGSVSGETYVIYGRTDLSAEDFTLTVTATATENSNSDTASTTTGIFVDVDGSDDDTIAGTAGEDVFDAGAGDDTLASSAGDDILTGGAGDDLFVFENGTGQDTIVDFSAGAGSDDVIDVGDFAFTDFADLLSSSTDVGPDVVIALDGDDSLTLIGVQTGDLHEDDFLL